jgi:dTMP kinase
MKSGPFSRLWRAGLVSSTGDWVAILATLSLAEELAGGGGIMLALTSRIVPGLFFAAIGGVIADRLNRKRVMIVVELGRAGLVLSLAFAESIAYLVLVNLALEGLTLLFQPAKEATVPSLVQRNELVRANSLSLSAAYGTFPLGAALFLLIAPLAPHLTFWGFLPGSHEGLAFLVDAGTYAASAAIITTLSISGRIRPREHRHRGRRRLSLMAPLRDLKEGVVFVTSHRRVRPVVAAMTVALAGGGIVVVLGKPFSREVLEAGTVGFPALLTAFGMGAGVGIVLVTVFGPRVVHKDLNFGLSLLVTGFALGAGGLVKTIFGGVGWIAVMGFGAGSAYVLGFSHLHEQTHDEIRGRTFAALFSLMRIGLLTSMMVALPLSELFDDKIPGLLSEGSRVVLLLGGATILLSGVATLWIIRPVLLELGQVSARPAVEAATSAFRSFRKALRGQDPDDTAEMDLGTDVADPTGPEGEG